MGSIIVLATSNKLHQIRFKQKKKKINTLSKKSGDKKQKANDKTKLKSREL